MALYFPSHENFCFLSWEPAALEHIYTWELFSVWTHATFRIK